MTHLLEDVRGFVRIERRDQPGGRLLVDGLEDVGRVVRVRFGERSPMFLMLLEVLLGLAWSAASQVSQRRGPSSRGRRRRSFIERLSHQGGRRPVRGTGPRRKAASRSRWVRRPSRGAREPAGEVPKGTEVETVAARARCTNWRQIGLLAHEALARIMGAIGARRGASPAGFPAPAVTPGTLHGVYEFDADVRPSPVADSRWSVDIAPRWNVGGAPNGGYLLSLLAATIGEALPHPHPFTITAHFMRRPRNGEGEIAVDLLRAGRSHSSAEARLYQDGSEMVRALAVFGDLAAERGGPTMITAAPPEMPFPEGLPSSVGFPGLPEIARRFDHRLTLHRSGSLSAGERGLRSSKDGPAWSMGVSPIPSRCSRRRTRCRRRS